MKKLFVGIFMLALSLTAFAQQEPKPLPMDPNVRYGHLDNGLTYYIVHNEEPAHRAEFFIAQRVGSILEEESQRGLAHFLEHMAFNGTKNYPGKGLLDYLQKHGVKFGTNVNAYTSIDETVYNVSDVPTDSTLHPNIIDSCLLILHDWSGYITLDGEEIDKERGVIHEEWRTRNNATMRLIQNELYPKLLPGSRYAHRMPIGLMSVVDSFSHEELRNYYQKWYRPDLQAVIVVGDVNVDTVEQRIRTLWQDIQTPADAAERYYVQVEGNDKPLVCVASDPEFAGNEAAFIFKRQQSSPAVKLSLGGYFYPNFTYVVSHAINNRLRDIALKADAPFQSASAGFSTYLNAKTLDAFIVSISPKPGMYREGMRAAMEVIRSVQQYGLTAEEIERAKAERKSSLERSYNEREKRSNGSYVSEIKRHFLNDEPMPGIETEWLQLYPIIDQNLDELNINRFCSSLIPGAQDPNSGQNAAAYYVGQAKEGNVIPTEEEVLVCFEECMKMEAKSYSEEQIAKQLIDRLPKPGKVKKSVSLDKGGDSNMSATTCWTLSNGVRVIWKKTDFKKDEISMSVVSPGGYRMLTNTDRINRQMAGAFYSLGGIGNFSPTQLQKTLAGKQASFRLGLNETTENGSGWCTPKDIRTMFELAYLSFTAPRQDMDVYESTVTHFRQNMKDRQGTPAKAISDSLTLTLYPGITEAAPLKLEELASLDYDKMVAMGRERFSNAADFTFYVIGNIDEDSLRVMCCQYLATLPANKKRETFHTGQQIVPGYRTTRFDIEMEQPKTSVRNYFHLYDQPWTLKEDLTLDMVGQILNIRFTETIREEEGGVYSPSARASFDELSGFMSLSYSFDTGADKCAHIEEVAYDELLKLTQPGGVREEDFQKVRDYKLKQHETQIKNNGWWMSQMIYLYQYGVDWSTGWEDTLKSITLSDIESMAARMLKGDRIQFVSNGIEKNAK